MLKLKHLFSEIKAGSVVVYSRDMQTGSFYKVTNTGTRNNLMEEIEEIQSSEIVNHILETLKPTPEELLTNQLIVSLKCSYENADFYAARLKKMALDQYNKEFGRW